MCHGGIHPADQLVHTTPDHLATDLLFLAVLGQYCVGVKTKISIYLDRLEWHEYFAGGIFHLEGKAEHQPVFRGSPLRVHGQDSTRIILVTDLDGRNRTVGRSKYLRPGVDQHPLEFKPQRVVFGNTGNPGLFEHGRQLDRTAQVKPAGTQRKCQ